jgi:hypothetical protein
MKEAEFLRAESLMCISRVRYLGLFAIGLGGAALPVLATILTEGAMANEAFGARVQRQVIAVQIILFGVTLAATALMQIYVGVFKQIFTFAAYFRRSLVPDLNHTLRRLDPSRSSAPVMAWELWLQTERAAAKLHVGDSDLRAEPLLIGLVSLIYASASLVTSLYTRMYLALSIILLAVTLAFIVRNLMTLTRILKASVET